MSAGEEEGFIAPPPGLVPKPVAAEPVEAEAVTTDEVISLPPGIVDSGTYRMPSARAPKPSTLDDAPAFFPVAAPGVPSAAPAAEVVAEVPSEVPDAEAVPAVAPHSESAIDDATSVAVGRRSAPAWRLTQPQGEQVLVEQTILIGRDPALNAQWPHAVLLPVIDPGKTVSKTHGAVELTESGVLLAHDLDSTNGVYLRSANGDEVDVAPGDPQPIEAGAELVLGEFVIHVDRS